MPELMAVRNNAPAVMPKINSAPSESWRVAVIAVATDANAPNAPMMHVSARYVFAASR